MRLVELKVSGQTVAEAVYNGDGHLVEVTVLEETTRYVRDWTQAENVLAEITSAGTTYNLYGLGLVAQKLPDGSVQYLLYDGMRSIRQLVDAQGAVTYVQTFDPYGGVHESAGSGASDYGYMGLYGLKQSPLLYYDGQWYHTGTGRFLSPQRGLPNPYVPIGALGFGLLGIGLVASPRLRKKKWGNLLLMLLVLGSVGMVVVACGAETTDTPPPPPPTAPPTVETTQPSTEVPPTETKCVEFQSPSGFPLDRDIDLESGDCLSYSFSYVTRQLPRTGDISEDMKTLRMEDELSVAVRLGISEIGADRLVHNVNGKDEGIAILQIVYNRMDDEVRAPIEYRPENIPLNQIYRAPGCESGSFKECATGWSYKSDSQGNNIPSLEFVGIGEARAFDPVSSYNLEVTKQAADIMVEAYYKVKNLGIPDITKGAIAFRHCPIDPEDPTRINYSSCNSDQPMTFLSAGPFNEVAGNFETVVSGCQIPYEFLP